MLERLRIFGQGLTLIDECGGVPENSGDTVLCQEDMNFCGCQGALHTTRRRFKLVVDSNYISEHAQWTRGVI